MTKERSDPEP